MSAFHAYDIRGIYNVDFDKETAYRVGYYAPKVLKATKVLVGRDVRISSLEIHEALINGLIDAGCEISDIGLCTTPMIYWGTAKFNFDMSVMITASHNPPEYNGLKISGKNSIPIGFDNGLNKIEQLIDTKPTEFLKGSYSTIDYTDEYIKFMQQYKKDISNLNITIDCSNGMSGLLVKQIFEKNISFLFDNLDGTFPNHEPNPLNEKNLIQIKKAVIENKSDIGVIYDGDADRVMFVDEKGNFIPPDLMIALLGHYFLEEKQLKGKVIQDIRTSKSVSEYLEPMGAEMIVWKVGRAYAANKLKENNGIFGGELAGHYYFRDFYFSDSGILASIIILNLISRFKKEGLKTSEIISKIRKYENSGEINFKLEHKKEAMEAIKIAMTKTETPSKYMDFDGYRIEFEDWWFNIRSSNTEPFLRLLIEAKNKTLMNKKIAEITTIINKFN